MSMSDDEINLGSLGDFEQETIRKSLSNNEIESNEATSMLYDLAISGLLDGSLSYTLQIWLGHQLSAILDDKTDPRAVLMLKASRGRPKGVGSIGASDEQMLLMHEHIALSLGTTRAEAVRILAEGLFVDVETVSTALKRGKRQGISFKGWPMTAIRGELPIPLREFIDDLTRS